MLKPSTSQVSLFVTKIITGKSLLSLLIWNQTTPGPHKTGAAELIIISYVITCVPFSIVLYSYT